jgi:CO/xanthine dehydrogenase FAD-binding subunit
LTRFHYVRPTTVEAAVATLQESGSRATLLAGGTDLLVRLRSGRIRPAVVVDLKRIETLESGIRVVDGTRDSGLGARGSGMLRIGARCTMTDLIANEQVRQTFPALVEAARVVGSVQIRNRATLAGNICNASPAADTAPPLLAYGAVVNTRGIAGERRVPLHQFFTGPGTTVLGRDEIVTSIDLPLPTGPIGAAFIRLTRRRGVDLATLTVCCAVSSAGEMRVALGAVAPTPLLVTGVDLPPKGGSHGSERRADLPAEEPVISSNAWLPASAGRTSDSRSLPPKGGSHGSELRADLPAEEPVINSNAWLPASAGRTSEVLRDPEHLERIVARIAAHARPISDVRAGSEYRSAMLPVFIRRTIELAVKRLDEYERWNPTGSPSPSR